MQQALGLIETKGLVGAIEAADAMAKAADVTIIKKEKITAALVTIHITGEVAAVRSALDAGAAAAQRVGQLVSVHIIPRPDDQLESIIYDNGNLATAGDSGKDAIEASTSDPSNDEAHPKDEEIFIEDKESSEPSDEATEEDTEDESEEDGPIEIPDLGTLSFEELEVMSVHKLRRLARGLAEFPIKGREISKANKQVLLEHFRTLK
ncbi:MAG: BMC domain-containing protein [Ignavibacteria bacterium]|jgi:microcompartment protein CcmL/EutN|nr:BMC domain-containing protein [Ignavibacteria bacterium]MCU7504072.1 BMC domain-containing protein [Ignavibacteria bacterium]MCU7518259.1 BMC domain-containing protein [Ignavibacteria bacterium]